MGFLKPKPEYVQLDPNFQPGPRNGHLSEPHPVYESAFGPVEEIMARIWNSDIPLAELRKALSGAPPTVPDSCPEPGRDVYISYTKVPVRDGTPIELKIYKSAKNPNPLNAALILRMHGGGWVVGSHETEAAELLYLGALPGVVLVSVDYRLLLIEYHRAPEFPFPYAINDCFDVLKWCKLNASYLGINTEKIIVAGSSAGANLATALSIKARDEDISGIVGQILTIPATCHPKFFGRVPNKENYELFSYVQNANAALVDAVRMEFFWDCYTAKNPHPDVYHSPLLSTNLRGLPPATVHVAGVDPLRDEGIAYAQALEAAGVPTELHVYKGLPHAFANTPGLKETDEYYERVVDFVKRRAAKDSRL